MNKLLLAAEKAFEDMEYKNKTIIPEFIKEQLIQMYGEDYLDQFEAFDETVVHIKDTNFYMSHSKYRAPHLLYRRKHKFISEYYDFAQYNSWQDMSADPKYCMINEDVSDNLVRLHKGIRYLTEKNYSWWTKFKLFLKST
jgi:hypothetical protein